MKLCQLCGKTLDDNASFCIDCGGMAVEAENGSAPVDYSSVALVSQETVFDTVKNCFKSRLFFITSLAFTVAMIIMIISAVISGSFDLSESYDYESGISDEIRSASNLLGVVLGLIFAFVPSLLMIGGMWTTYISAKKDKFGTKGFTLVKVSVIITLVFTIIAIICCILALPYILEFRDTMAPLWTDLFGNEDLSENPGAGWFVIIGLGSLFMVAAFITVIIMAIVFLALAIIYIAFSIRTLNCMKSTVRTGEVKIKGSMFVAIMSLIAGGIMFLPSLGSLFGGEFEEFYSGLLMLLFSAAPILLGSFLLYYRSKMSALIVKK